MKINLSNSKNTKLRGGPKVFMDRLKKELEITGDYSENNFDSWLNLSFRKIPNEYIKNKQIILRFDGIWNMEFIPRRYYINSFLKKKINNFMFDYFNKLLIYNYYHSDKVIFQSNFSKKLVETLLINKKIDKKYIIISNGVDIDRFKPLNKKLETTYFPNILVSHKMWPSKRFYQVPLIIKQLKNIYPDIRVNVLGDGIKNPYNLFKNTLQYFKDEVKKQELEKYFKFHGHINPDKLSKFYIKNDFMLNLSFNDPCPNVVIESLACGLPIVAPNHGGISELVANKELLVTEKINEYETSCVMDYKSLPIIPIEKYIDKIKLLLGNLQKYKKNARKKAILEYDIKKITQRYINFIKD